MRGKLRVVSVLGIFLLLLPAAVSCRRNVRRMHRAPPPVTVVRAEFAELPVEVSAIGTVVPVNTITVTALVGGKLREVKFREGDDVLRGQLLFQIDPRPFEEALEQARSLRGRDQAQQRFADDEARRYALLFQRGLVARNDTEQYTSQARALAAVVQADQATVRAATINLGYTSIRSPIDGRTGGLLVNAGNLIKANDTPLVTIRQIRPIYVSFSVPQGHLPSLREHSGKMAATVTTGDRRTERGELTFIDNTVDLTTGTVALKATLPNDDRALWPGQFVDVSLRLGDLPRMVVVPEGALQIGQRGDYLFVVDENGLARMRSVRVALRARKRAAIAEGVAAGERVVTDGQLSLIDGTHVQIVAEPRADAGERSE